ncbi:MAG: hypothetical protein J0H78_20945 [Rhizobiales bacterium]|nr:hypothetical protein [Hyphomicrobiales bacterium]
MRRSFAALLFATALVVLTLPTARAERVTVTHWGVLMYGAPYAVAIDKGFYKEQA